MAILQNMNEDGILEITMDNPPVNALNIDDTFEIAAIFNNVAKNQEIKVAILTASGKGFCAGVDIKEIQALSGNEGILNVNQACYDAFAAVYECAVPVIAAVNDFCLGSGIGLAGSADIVVAADQAQFGLPEVDNGALGALTHLQRLVPQQRARQMLYTCETAPAEELASYGTIYDVVPKTELMETARNLAKRIAKKQARTIRAAKRSANGIEIIDIRNSYRYEQGYTFELNLVGEGEKARQAFLDGQR
ncbi:MAG: enoyl-CoA hydratase family protein [Acidimicrobiales bacterium]|jgi:enoyl-CoA hydratase|nr:enoyl-CoA hydratase family protein [Acidimicrobiales bacterium]MDP6299153.1 enoyl-CoA hydratase family protein [Acidimicrobiales bacterium]HJM29437.1 enoyl-CoA hydratase family protein [Acidimicrobiales bacterium]HJM98498.1 enoyl-CoA hydratase family protein [Acidimicrobiales bacterium]